jgi:hypothetical protein
MTMDASVIPAGLYCYDDEHVCRYWSLRADRPHQANGFCAYLGKGDVELGAGSLLWDQCKECGVNDE